MAEQLALDQLTGNRGAIDFDERFPRARRLTVQCSRDELLSRAVLTGDQHTRGGVGHPFDAFDQRADRERLADDLIARFDRRLEPCVFLGQIDPAGRVAQRDENAVGVERFLEDVVRTELRRLDRILDRRVPADHDHDGRGVAFAQSLQRLEPVHPRHLHVQEHQLRLPLLVHAEPLDAGRRRAHFEAFVLQELSQRRTNPLFVIHHQQATAHGTDLYRTTCPFATRTSASSRGTLTGIASFGVAALRSLGRILATISSTSAAGSCKSFSAT